MFSGYCNYFSKLSTFAIDVVAFRGKEMKHTCTITWDTESTHLYVYVEMKEVENSSDLDFRLLFIACLNLYGNYLICHFPIIVF